MKYLLLLALVLASPVRADVTLGAVLSLTGPGAGLGVPARNTIELLPKTMAGEPVRWVVLDNDSYSITAVRSVRKLVEEERVDAILGPSTSPDSVAVLDAAVGPALLPARPATPEFHSALRDRMARVRDVAGPEGVVSLAPGYHSGAEPVSQVLIEIRGGGYRLVQP